MRPSVTVILVARNAAHILDRTISALHAQTRMPDRVAMVNIESADSTREIMRDAAPELLLTLPADTPFGAAVGETADELDALDGDDADGWLWLLGADNTPELDALEQLLATVERNPSLAVTGPKQVRRDDPAVIVEYGQSMTTSGASVVLHQGELDQGQFESLSDVLAVGGGGMLVRRSTWRDLGGFDPGLPVVDDALDFCQRVWLSGGRVLLTPEARVERDGDPATLLSESGERMSAGDRIRERRRAQLHRRLSSASSAGFVLHWLGLIPGALVRMVWTLLRKVPGRILPELSATFDVFFGGSRARAARERFAATQTEPMSTIDRLRISPAEQRRVRELRREELRASMHGSRREMNFIGTGGAWVLLLAFATSVIAMLPLFGADALRGGALAPLSGSIGEIWGAIGYGVRDPGTGAAGVADPFAFVLALLGTLTFWHPSASIVALWFLAMPLAALTGWLLAANLTERAWMRAVAGIGWMLAPPLLGALNDGRIAGVIAHICLPLTVWAALRSRDTWRGVATLSLLGALVAACSPSLIPAMALMWLVSLTGAGLRWGRQLIVPIPTLVMFLPLAITQIRRGNPVAIAADPGIAAPYDPARAVAALLGFPTAQMGGWVEQFAGSGGELLGMPVLLILLALPTVMAVIIGLIGRNWRSALAGIGMWALGAFTALTVSGLELASVADRAVPVWIGAAQSLMLLGFGITALSGLTSLKRFAAGLLATLVLASSIAAGSVPALAQQAGVAKPAPGSSQSVPSIVQAQGSVDEDLGTLIITPHASGSMRVSLDRGTGDTLDGQSTLRSTAPELTAGEKRLAELAVLLASDPAAAPVAEMHALGIGYVLVTPPDANASGLAARITRSLDANSTFVPAGTSEYGTLWHVSNSTTRPADADIAAGLRTGNADTWVGRGILATQTAVLVIMLLLALPTGTLEADAALATTRRRTPWLQLDGPEEERIRALDASMSLGQAPFSSADGHIDDDEVMVP